MSNITLTPVKKNSVITLTPVKKPKLNLQSPDYELTTAISGQPKYKEQIQDFIDKPFISLNKPDVPIIKPTINLQLPTQEMEQAIQPPQPYKKESKAKDVVDAFRLGFVDLYNKGKMYVTTALPQFAEYAQQPEVAQPMFKDDNERKIFQEELGAKYKQQKLEYQKWITNHPELQPRPEYEGSVIENLKKNPSLAKDPFYWGYIISSNAPYTVATMGTTLATTFATGNPILGGIVGMGVATLPQAGDVYDDLIQSGATQEQATNISTVVAPIISAIEIAGDLPILKAVSKPFAKLLSKNIAKEIGQETFKTMAKRGLKTFTTAEISETAEEISQQAIQNAAVKTINKDRAILKDVPETVVQTLVSTLPFAMVGGIGASRQLNMNGGKVTETQIAEQPQTTQEVTKPTLPEPLLAERTPEPIKDEFTNQTLEQIKPNIIPPQEKTLQSQPSLSTENIGGKPINPQDNIKPNVEKVIIETPKYSFGQATTTGEEYIKGKPIYHATDTPEMFNIFEPDLATKGERYFNPLGKGLYLSSSREFVSRFGKNVFEYILPKDAKIKVITDKVFTEREYPIIIKEVLRGFNIKYDDLSLGEKVELNRVAEKNVPIQALNEAEFLIREDILPKHNIGFKSRQVQNAFEEVSTKRNSKYDVIIYRTTDDIYGNADEIIVPKEKIHLLKTKEQLAKEFYSGEKQPIKSKIIKGNETITPQTQFAKPDIVQEIQPLQPPQISQPKTAGETKEIINSSADIFGEETKKLGWEEIPRGSPERVKIADTKYYTLKSPDGVRVAFTLQHIYTRPDRSGVWVASESFTPSKNKIVLEAIVTPEGLRKKGLATKALEEIKQIADKHNITISLEPQTMKDYPNKELSNKKLVEYYKKRGFVQRTEGDDRILEYRPTTGQPLQKPQVSQEKIVAGNKEISQPLSETKPIQPIIEENKTEVNGLPIITEKHVIENKVDRVHSEVVELSEREMMSKKPNPLTSKAFKELDAKVKEEFPDAQAIPYRQGKTNKFRIIWYRFKEAVKKAFSEEGGFLKLFNKNADEIKKRTPKWKEEYGVSGELTGNDVDLLQKGGALEGIKDFSKSMLKDLAHTIESFDLTQNYIYRHEDSKPIALGAVDASVREIAYTTIVKNAEHAQSQATHKDAIAKLLVEAEKTEAETHEPTDVVATVKNNITEGTKEFDESDLRAIKSAMVEKKIIRNALIKYVLGLNNVKIHLLGTESVIDGQGRISDYVENVIVETKDVKGNTQSKEMKVNDYDEIVKDLNNPQITKDVKNTLPYVNWIPHNRSSGRFWVNVYDNEFKKVFSARVPDEKTANEMKANIEKQGYKVNIRPHNYKLRDTISYTTMSEIMYALDQMGVDPQSAEAQKIINFYKSQQTLLSSLIHRQNVAGYRVDYKGIMKGLSNKAKASVAKSFRQDTKDLMPLLDNIQDDFRRNVARTYIDALSTKTENIPFLNGLRTTTYFTLLANKMSYVVQNLSEPIWALARIPDLRKPFLFSVPLSQEYRDLHKRAMREGIIKPFMSKMMGGEVMSHLDYLGRGSETLSSQMVFDIGLRIARDKGLRGQDAYKEAYQFLYNVGKPFYREANTPILLNKKSGGIINKYGFVLMRWLLDWITKFAFGSIKNKLLTTLAWVVLAGFGNDPFGWGRKLMRKLHAVDFEKDPHKMSILDKFLLGGVPGMIGISPRFLIPYFAKGFQDVGSFMKSSTILLDYMKRAYSANRNYGWSGSIGYVPMAGVQYLAKGIIQAEKGVPEKRGGKVRIIYKPDTMREKIITGMGLSTIELQEIRQRAKEIKKPKSKPTYKSNVIWGR